MFLSSVASYMLIISSFFSLRDKDDVHVCDNGVACV